MHRAVRLRSGELRRDRRWACANRFGCSMAI